MSRRWKNSLLLAVAIAFAEIAVFKGYLALTGRPSDLPIITSVLFVIMTIGICAPLAYFTLFRKSDD
ncbi:MAG: hypothetical protein CR993_06090 [Rhodobacterales bacterium]|nr:MAG: hypothetical protein CR993_06090 [Rhodobacterales bacterium]